MTEIAPRKTIVEARVAPKLSFYSKMDGAGEAILSSMKTNLWERSPFSIELLDVDNQEKVVLEHDRFHCEMDGPLDRQLTSAKRGFSLIKEAMGECGIGGVRRLGVRQFFAIEFDGNTEERLISKLDRAYLATDALASVTKMGVKDFAVVLELRGSPDSHFSGRLSLGGMKRSQWTSYTPYNVVQGRGPNHLGKRSVQQIVQELPESFVFVDIDKAIGKPSSTDEIDFSKCESFIESVSSDMKQIANQIIRDLRGVTL